MIFIDPQGIFLCKWGILKPGWEPCSSKVRFAWLSMKHWSHLLLRSNSDLVVAWCLTGFHISFTTLLLDSIVHLQRWRNWSAILCVLSSGFESDVLCDLRRAHTMLVRDGPCQSTPPTCDQLRSRRSGWPRKEDWWKRWALHMALHGISTSRVPHFYVWIFQWNMTRCGWYGSIASVWCTGVRVTLDIWHGPPIECPGKEVPFK